MQSHASLIDDDRFFPPDPSTRAIARRLYQSVKDLPLVSPHGHTDPRWYAEDQPLRRSGDALRRARPLHFSDALQPGGPAGGPRHQAERRGGDRFRSARGLAALRRELSPLPRHADADVARPHLCDALRLHRAAFGEDRRPLFRPHQRGACDAGVSSARALRALQHRGHRDDRQPARPARIAPGDPGVRAGTAASFLPIGRMPSSIRMRTVFRTTSNGSATSPSAIR